MTGHHPQLRLATPFADGLLVMAAGVVSGDVALQLTCNAPTGSWKGDGCDTRPAMTAGPAPPERGAGSAP